MVQIDCAALSKLGIACNIYNQGSYDDSSLISQSLFFCKQREKS